MAGLDHGRCCDAHRDLAPQHIRTLIPEGESIDSAIYCSVRPQNDPALGDGDIVGIHLVGHHTIGQYPPTHHRQTTSARAPQADRIALRRGRHRGKEPHHTMPGGGWVRPLPTMWCRPRDAWAANITPGIFMGARSPEQSLHLGPAAGEPTAMCPPGATTPPQPCVPVLCAG